MLPSCSIFHTQRESYLHAPFLAFIGLAVAWFLLLVHWIKHSKSSTIRRFAWGVSGGSLTGFQNFLKDSLTILKCGIREDNVPWGLLICLSCLAALTSFTGLLLLTSYMKRYDATYSAAMFVGSFVVSASIMSAVHYDTFYHLNDNCVFYPTGLFILMTGVHMLITENPPQYRVSPAVSRSPSHTSLGLVGLCLFVLYTVAPTIY